MTVYVDALRTSGTKTWCHLLADEQAELERMADRLHLRELKDGSGKGRVLHYDLTAKLRAAALARGAVEKEEQ